MTRESSRIILSLYLIVLFMVCLTLTMLSLSAETTVLGKLGWLGGLWGIFFLLGPVLSVYKFTFLLPDFLWRVKSYSDKVTITSWVASTSSNLGLLGVFWFGACTLLDHSLRLQREGGRLPVVSVFFFVFLIVWVAYLVVRKPFLIRIAASREVIRISPHRQSVIYLKIDEATSFRVERKRYTSNLIPNDSDRTEVIDKMFGKGQRIRARENFSIYGGWLGEHGTKELLRVVAHRSE